MEVSRIIGLIILCLSLIVITLSLFIDVIWPILIVVAVYLNTIGLLVIFSFQKVPTNAPYTFSQPSEPVQVSTPPRPVPLYKCRICQVEFKTEKKLQQHFIKDHAEMIRDI